MAPLRHLRRATLPLALVAVLPLVAAAAPRAKATAPAPTSAAATAVPKAAAPAAPGWRHDWARGAVFYEVFVRSFADSNGDGIGDLPGLTSRLDYLQSLGVDALWLMPIFPSPSYHGYDPSDFDHVDPAYGTDADLDRLLAEAHRRGLRVILDLPLNHTSDDHPWFRESASSRASPRRDWYVWRDEDPGWTQPWSGDSTWHRRNGAYYYSVFWEHMPDLNLRNPAVRAEAKRIARAWLERGVDGFRLDAVRYLVEGPDGELMDRPETHAFWKEWAGYVRSLRPDAVLVGELMGGVQDVAPYFGDTAALPEGDELPMMFDFAVASGAVASLQTGSAGDLFYALREAQGGLPRAAIDAPFLGNHDLPRLASLLRGDRQRLGVAAAVLLTLPGAPFLYYGDELGLQGGGPGLGSRAGPQRDDEAKRTPMPWDATPGGGFTRGEPWQAFSGGREAVNVAAEERDAGSLLARYRELIALRRGSEALRHGDLSPFPPRGGLLAFVRASAGERVLVVHNLGATPATTAPLALAAGALRPIFVDAGVEPPARADGGWTVTLPAFSSGVWRVEP